MINREILYERNLTGSYMKIPAGYDAEFDEKMMLRKKLPGLLPVEKCYVDGAGQYWYNISGRQSLDTFCHMKSLGIDFVERMIVSICSEIEILEWNLLQADSLLLDPEFIFITNSNQEVIFTIYPGAKDPISKEFQQLMEYLLTKIDHKDMNAVHMAYSIYEKTLDDGYSIMDIRDSIMESKEILAKEQQAVSKARKTGTMMGNEYAVKEKKQKEQDTKSVKDIKNERDTKTINDISNRSEIQKDKIPAESYHIKKEWIEKLKHLMGLEETNTGGHLYKEEQQENPMDRLFGRLPYKIQKLKQKINPNVSKEPMKPLKKRDIEGQIEIVYPKEEEHNKVEEREVIHPTVCLSDYREHPEGLLLYEGLEHFENIKIVKEISKIGQGEEVDIVIAKDTISHFHAKIECIEQEYYIEDLNSTNGTYVNDSALSYKERKKLCSNDIIRFADVKYRFI